MLDRLLNGDSLPALERTLQFASARQAVIANNIANLETPGFRPADVSPETFQGLLRDALDERQAAQACGIGGAETLAADHGLALPQSDAIRIGPHGMTLEPQPLGEGILFHDGNDRSLERILQSLTENLMTFRFAASMVRSRFASIDSAIRERP